MRPIRNRAKPPLCGRAPSALRAALGPAPASRSLVGAALPLTQAHSPGLDTWALCDLSAHSARLPRLQERRPAEQGPRPSGAAGWRECPETWGTTWVRYLVGRSMHVSATVRVGKQICACSSP